VVDLTRVLAGPLATMMLVRDDHHEKSADPTVRLRRFVVAVIHVTCADDVRSGRDKGELQECSWLALTKRLNHH
jgi:hypothetical protein